MSQGSQPSTDTEDDLLDWIESGANSDEDLRQVLKYLVLLNASAVKKAIRYVQRGKPPQLHPTTTQRRNAPLDQLQVQSVQSVQSTPERTQTLPPPQNQVPAQKPQTSQPTPPRVPLTSTSHHTPVNSVNTSIHSIHSINKPLLLSAASTSSPRTKPPPPPSSQQQVPQQLLVLCTSKPSCKEEGDDQDNAMKICREVPIVPYIVLKESKPALAAELMQLSKKAYYPQFFWKKTRHEEESTDDPAVTTTFLGDYATVLRLHLQGLFRPSVASGDALTSPSPAATTTGTTNIPSHERLLVGERRQLDFNAPLPSPRPPQVSSMSSDPEDDPQKSSTDYQPSETASSSAMSQRLPVVVQQPPSQPSVPSPPPDPTLTVAPTLSPPPLPQNAEPSLLPQTTEEVVDSLVVRSTASPLRRPSGHLEEPDDLTVTSSTKPPGAWRRANSPQQGSKPQPSPSPKTTETATGTQSSHPTDITEVDNCQPEMAIESSGTTPLPTAADSFSNSSGTTADSTNTQKRTNITLAAPLSETVMHHVEDTSPKAHMSTERPELQRPLRPVVEAISGSNDPSASIAATAASTDPLTTDSMPATSSEPHLNHHYPKLPLPFQSVAEAPPTKRVTAVHTTTNGNNTTEATPSEPPLSPFPKLPLPAQAVIDTSSSATASSNRWKIMAQTTTSSESQLNRYPKLPVPIQPAAMETTSTRSANTNTNVAASSRTHPSNDSLITSAPPASSSSSIDPKLPSSIPPQVNDATSSSDRTSPIMTATPTPVEPPILLAPPQRIISQQQPSGVGACYLVYDAVQAELNIFYSEFFMDGSVGVWTTPHIKAFKEAQGLGQSEMIGNCASGVQDPQQYCQGWCQFIMAAKSMEATVMILLFDVGGGMPVDFYLYSGGTTKLVQSGDFETENIDAVACLPKNADFSMNLKGKKWSKAAKKLGSVAIFRSLTGSVNVNGSASTTHQKQMPDTPSTVGTPATPLTGSSDGFPSGFRNDESSPMLPSPSSVSTSPRRLDQDMAPAPLLSASVSHPEVPSTNNHDGYLSAAHAPNPPNGASYLIYDPDSSGRLVEHCSKTPVPDAIGRWVPHGSKKLSGFKFTQNLGRTVLIGNCSAGVQGRRNYSSGWCQFVRSARVMEAEVMMWDPVAKGLMVDVYLYQDDPRPSFQTVKLLPGVAQSVDKTLAVACIPKNTPFYEGMCVDILKWLADGSNYGASSRF